jgi:hypothetical protein
VRARDMQQRVVSRLIVTGVLLNVCVCARVLVPLLRFDGDGGCRSGLTATLETDTPQNHYLRTLYVIGGTNGAGGDGHGPSSRPFLDDVWCVWTRSCVSFMFEIRV